MHQVDDDQHDTAQFGFDDHRTDGAAILDQPTIIQKMAFEIIRRVRKLVEKADTQANKTRADYTRTVRLFEKTLGYPLDGSSSTGCLELLNTYALRQSTFRKHKSAICWFLRQGLRRVLAEQDQLQRRGNHGESWINVVMKLGQMAKEYRRVNEHKRIPPEIMEGMAEPESESKRRDLPIIKKKYNDWDERMLDGSSRTTYEDVVHTMRLVGPRPAELATGVCVALEMSGEASLTIKGAKVDGVRGQVWRKLFFPLSDLPIDWQHRLQDKAAFVVAIHSPDGLRSALRRISERVLPGVPACTAYVFRHAIATRLRRQGFSAGEIGGFLGHSAAETQSTYGCRSARVKGRKKLRETSLIRISTERPVRPQDLSGLTKIIEGKATKNPSRTTP